MPPRDGAVRFGFVTANALALPEWQVRCLEALLKVPRVELVAAVTVSDRAPVTWPRARSLRPVPLAGRIPGVHPLPLKSLQSVTEQQTRALSDLDVLLDLGSGTKRGALEGATRRGLWEFQFGGVEEAPPGFWEVFDAGTSVSAALRRRPDGAILRRGEFRTYRHSLSLTIDEVLFGAAAWPAAVARAFLGGVPEGIETPFDSKQEARRRPTRLDAVRLRGREILRTVSGGYMGLFRHDEWAIGLVDAPIHAFLDPDFRPTARWFPAPGGSRFGADPFGVEVDGRLSVVYEDFDYRTGLGRIASFDPAVGIPSSTPQAILPLPGHASYPFLLQHGGETYCLPETQASGELSLFRAVEPPHRWEKEATLLRGVPAVDGTLFRFEGRWWLSATRQDAGQNLNLFFWHAPALEGPWAPHDANPVKTDIRGARPGGTPFVHEGVLYRPAQDCSGGYGRRIVIQKVTRLTTTEFREEVARFVEPIAGGPFPDGMHTLSSVGERTLVDGKRLRFIPRAMGYALRRGLAGARP